MNLYHFNANDNDSYLNIIAYDFLFVSIDSVY